MISVGCWMGTVVVAVLLSGSAMAEAPAMGAASGTSVPHALGGLGVGTSGAPADAPLRVEIVEDPADTQRVRRTEEDGRRREDDDLAAQQSMAESTQKIVVISWWQAVFSLVVMVGSLIGTAAVVVSLWFSRQATQAAIRAVKLSEEVAQTELRAYLAFEGVTVDQSVSKPIELKFVFRNCGNTPAFVECYKINAVYRHVAAGNRIDEQQVKVSITVGANQAVDIAFDMPTVDDLSDRDDFVTYDHVDVFIGVHLDYHTIFPGLTGHAEIVMVRSRTSTDFSFVAAAEEDREYYREQISRLS